MRPLEFLRSLFAQSSAPVASPKTAQTFRPNLETLESRLTPAVTVGASFRGLSFPQSGGSIPPDTSIAVGPNHIVEVINSSIGIFSKTGQLLQLRPIDTFFNAPGAGSFDPLVTYDAAVGRFVVLALQQDSNNETSSMFFAVSNNANPLLGFTERHQINTRQVIGGTPGWGDYPKLGYNNEAYVVTLNMFDFPGSAGFLNQVQIISIAKSSVLDSNPATLTNFVNNRTNTNEFTLTPGPMYGAPANSPIWMTARGVGGGNTMRLLRMSNVLSNAATFAPFDVAVTPYTIAPNATQQGGNPIDSVGDRIMNTEWRNNRLVTTHTSGFNGVATVRWHEFSTRTATPTLVQQGQIAPGAGIHTTMPAITISPGGALAMTFMQSSATQFMSMWATTQLPGAPLGVMQAPVLIKAGERTYSDFGGPPYRSGDYAGIAVDPVNGSVWIANEFATNATADNWGTWIANLPLPFAGSGGQRFSPGNTSDTASTFAIAAGSTFVFNPLLGRSAKGFPQYHWYRFLPRANGTLNVSLNPQANGGLEFYLYVRVGRNLVRLSGAQVGTGATRLLRTAARLGREYFIQVKGQQNAPSTLTTGLYTLTVNLGA
jgi:hypothetical protein